MKNSSDNINVFPHQKKSRLGKLYISWVMLNLYPQRTIFILACLFVASMAEGLGLLTILPLIEIINQNGESTNSKMVEVFLSVFNFLNLDLNLVTILTVMVFLIFLKAIVAWGAMTYVGKVMADITAELRNALVCSTLFARWSFFISRPIGKLINAVSVEASGATNVYSNSIKMLADFLKILVLLSLAFYVAPKLVLLALLIGGAMVFFLDYFLVMSRDAGKRIVELMQSVTSAMADTLQGIKPLKAMNCERWLIPVLSNEIKEIKHAMFKQAVAQEVVRAVHEPIVVLVVAVGTYFAINSFSVPMSELFVLILLFHRTIGGINTMQGSYQKVLKWEHYYWSVADFINSATNKKEVPAGDLKPNLEKNIILKDVSFSYEDKEVLKDVSMEIPSFSLTALVGQSGSGKTTLTDLLCGLYLPNSGDILVDGVLINEIDTKQWRSSIGYVPQDLFLFHDTITKNITLGDPKINAESVERALCDAGAMEFVSALPEGINTIIGERGSRLSGGQRQRISIARALVRKPKLLILDEATTALDKETERSILGTLRKLSKEFTVIAVSHQSALLDVADKIYRLDEGRAVQIK